MLSMTMNDSGFKSIGQSKKYELELLPSRTLNPRGHHYIEADVQWISVERMKYWIEQCDTHGPKCNEPFLSNDEDSFESTFIDVQLNCLVKGKLEQKYIALSYVWGQQRNVFQTTVANSKDLMQRDSLLRAWDRIPATIRDAIILAGLLGSRFLWVDRLCIVQDDEESIHSNIAKMASVFAKSYVTIVATDGDSDTGIPGVTGGSTPRFLPQERLLFRNKLFLVGYRNTTDRYGAYIQASGPEIRGPRGLEQERTWHKRAW